MMKRVVKIGFVIISILLIELNCAAQLPSWQWAYGTNSLSATSAVTTDLSDNVIIGGNSPAGGIIIGNDTLSNSNTGMSVFVAKFNSTGTFLWAATSDGYLGGADILNAITTDLNENIYIVGDGGYSNVVFGNDTLVDSQVIGGFIVKYSPSGSVLWAKSVTYSTKFNSVTTDALGNVYVTGNYNGIANFGSVTLTGSANSAFVLKYDMNGNLLWANNIGISNSYTSQSIVSDTSGFFVSGSFNSPTLVIGSTTLTNNCSYYNAYLAKYDTAGNVLWAKSGGGKKHNDFYWEDNHISTDKLGNVYLAGTLDSINSVFDTYTFSPSSLKDMYIIKYNSSGSIVWAQSKDSCNSTSVSADSQGYVYLSGRFNHPSITFGTSTINGNNDYIVKYNINGIINWAKGINIYDGYLATDNSGSLYLGGSYGFSGTPTSVTFGTITLVDLDNSGDGRAFIAKLNSTTGINELPFQSSSVNLYPNPATTAFTIESTAKLQSIKLMDVLGKELLKQVENDNKTATINMAGFAKGIYFISITDENNTVTNRKLVME